MGGGVQQGEAYLGFAALQPVVKEGVIGTADVGGKVSFLTVGSGAWSRLAKYSRVLSLKRCRAAATGQ